MMNILRDWVEASIGMLTINSLLFRDECDVPR